MSEAVQDCSHLLKHLNGLPPFPASALRLLSISTESETAIGDYERVFKSDQALATDLLVVANSAEFGLRARVDDIQHALTLLGLNRVNSLSVTLAMRLYMRNAPRLAVIQPLWAHSIASAVIAETLGKVRGLSVSALYTAGLVHDVGRLGLLMATENRYARLLAQPVAGSEKACALEKEQFGLTHSEAGGIMAASWGFPAWLCSAIRCHHMDETQPPDERLQLVRLACTLAGTLGYEEHGDNRPRNDVARLELPAELRGCAGLDQESLQSRISSLLAAISRPA